MTSITERVISALTAGSDGLRAHRNKLPPPGDPGRVLPAAVVNEIAGHDERDLRGADGLRRRIMRVDVWGTTRRGADDAMEVAMDKMDAATTFTVAGSEPSWAPGFDDEANLYRASVDFTLWFERS